MTMKSTFRCLRALCCNAFLIVALPSHGVETHLQVRTGIAVAPVYQGAKTYSPAPIIGVEAGMHQQDWGALTASETGLTWQLPIDKPFGVALVAGYDVGRDEEIRTWGGRDKTLKGMGDLNGAIEAGTQFSYDVEPYRFYLKALRALKKRKYGGEELSYTTHGNLGAEVTFPLPGHVTTVLSLISTWGDKNMMNAYFGVTRQQAQNTSFRQYQPKAGFKDVMMQAALNYELSPSVSLQSGCGVNYLVGEAAKSPLTEKKLAGIAFFSGSYTF